MNASQLAFLRANETNLEAVGDKVVDVLAEVSPPTAQVVTPDDAQGNGNTILPTSRYVQVAANTNDADDFVVLPALADVPIGHTVTVVGNSAGCEVRTPSASNEKINAQDSDGTKEYAFASGTGVYTFTKISSTVGWMGHGFTALGAVISAVVPD